MITRLLRVLRAHDPDITLKEVAEAVWLALQRRQIHSDQPRRPEFVGGYDAESVQVHTPPNTSIGIGLAATTEGDHEDSSSLLPAAEEVAGRSTSGQRVARQAALYVSPDDHGLGLPMRSPTVPAIPHSLDIARSLRPLRRKVDSRRKLMLDEPGTAQDSADADVCLPRMRPVPDRWMDLALVVDASASMVIWRRTIAEFRVLLERLGAFRDVRMWRFDADEASPFEPTRLRAESDPQKGMGRDPRELIDPTGRRIVLVVSDCVGAGWANDAVASLLRLWGHAGPVGIVQCLPQRLWDRCAASFAPVKVRAGRPAVPNNRLETLVRHDGLVLGAEAVTVPHGFPVPVMELSARWLGPWASLVAGTASGWTNMMAVLTGEPAEPQSTRGLQIAVAPNGEKRSPLERVVAFRASASPTAFKLASYCAAAPMNLAVMRLVAEVMLPEARPSHLAEVFLGRLLRRVSPMDPSIDPDEVMYDFQTGVRELLLSNLRRHEAVQVLRRTSEFVGVRFGSTTDFLAWLAVGELPGDDVVPSPFRKPFATVKASVLCALGGSFAAVADGLHEAGSIRPEAARPAEGMAGGSFVTAQAEAVTATGDQAPASSQEPVELPGAAVTSTRAPIPSAAAVADRSQQGEHVAAVLEREQAGVILRGVPPHNPHFTGRDPLLDALRTRLGNRATALVPQALHGLGGVGKTQVAAEYVRRYVGRYQLVRWIAAEHTDNVRLALASLATELGVPESADTALTAAAVVDALRSGIKHPRWLLIFDNADEPADLTPFFPMPSAHGHILVTSRNHDWAAVADKIEVDVFTRKESIEFICRRSVRTVGGRSEPTIDKRDANRLAEKLGDLPLALDQAAAWHVQTGMSVDEYLELFDQRASQLLDAAPPGNYPHSVATTFSLAFEQLELGSPEAAELLKLCAFFGSQPIATQIFYRGRHVSVPEPFDKAIRDEIKLYRAVRDIGRYALAQVDATRDKFMVHRLVQAVLRDRISGELRGDYHRMVQELLAAASPGDPDDRNTWEQYDELAPHVIAADLVEGETPEIRKAVLEQIRFRYRQGDFKSSCKLAAQAAELWAARLGPNHEQTLVANYHLANATRSLGDPRRAREINKDTLERLKEHFGEDDERALVTANSYGADLRIYGDFVGARALDEDSLARHRRVFGEMHPNTLRSANNLAVDLRLLGDFAGARKLDEDTLSRRTNVLGPDNVEILSSLGSVARDLFGQGKYRTARETLETPLARFEATLGEDHPGLMRGRRIRAAILRKLGLYEEAYALAESNLKGYRTRFGDDHIGTLGVMVTVCNSLRVLGRLEEARELGEEALGRYQQTLGDAHPFTHACATDLAIVLRAMSEHDRARELSEQALPKLRQLLGERHPHTLCCASNLTNALFIAGEHNQARKLSAATYELSKQVRGVDHPNTLACATNLVIDLRQAGDDKRAQELGEDTLLRLERVLGERHPETRAAIRGARAECDIELPST